MSVGSIGGRKTLTLQRSVAVNTSSTAFLDANPERIAVIFSAPAANRVTLSLMETAVDREGLVLYSGQAPILLTRESFGDMVCQRWTAISVTAEGNQVGVTEVLVARY